MKKDKKTIWLIRHAQSEANINKNYKADSFSTPLANLSNNGLKQAKKIPNYFLSTPNLIITSSFLRTKQTAEPLIKKYPNVPQEEWPIQEFTYLSIDKSFNTTIDERRPLMNKYWDNNNPSHIDGDGSESFIDFMNRAYGTINMLKNRKEKFIVLFSHEYTISAIKYILEKNPKKITHKEMQAFRNYFLTNRISNASKTEFFFNIK